MAEGARLLSECVVAPHRGFKSHSLRHFFIMKHIFLIPLTFLLFLLALCACDKGVTALPAPEDSTHSHQGVPETMPPSSQPPVSPKNRKVIEPEWLRGAWRGATLKIVDRETSKAWEVDVPLRREQALEGTPFRVEILYFFPSFLMTAKTITCVSKELKNPAAKISLSENGTTLMNHWVFANMPQVHRFDHPRWSITLVKGVPNSK